MPQQISGGATPPIRSTPLWSWDTSMSVPTVSGYPNAGGAFGPTKTGLTPADVQAFVGVPLQYYGNPPTPVDPATILEWIRWAEDMVEQETSILLCQTWVASPPARLPEQAAAIGVATVSGQGQIQGYDYDIADAGYDFFFNRAQDSGWLELTLRFRPVQSVQYTTADFTAIKRTSFIYPLLNQFFTMPSTWNVEDRDFGFVRYVPAANVQMLPLFAMQLAFMGFAENVPGAIWLQYTAGLTPFDLKSRWSFMLQLVLCEVAITALNAIQGTINMGALKYMVNADGLSYETSYAAAGPYAGLINSFTKRRDSILGTARTKLQGLPFMML